MTARSVALVALERIENGAYSNLVLPPLLRGSGLDARERAFATDLVYGTVRRRRALDFLLAPRSSQPLARLEPTVRAALRMGAYQLVDGVPAHAAVGETVTAVATRAPAARGYVNGVLRALARDGPPWPWPGSDSADALGVRYSQPDWLVAMLLAQFGVDTTRAVLASADTAPAVTLRVNPRRATPESVEAELVAAGVRVERGRLLPEALVATGLGDVGALAVVREGRATPQDQASQAVARLVAALAANTELSAPARVLDVAAAPGGKATGIAELAADGVLVVAGDVNPSRAGRIGLASERLGLRGVVPLVADGRRPPFRPGSFDVVLVDAPCTGLGVLRRRPDARWRVDPAAVETLASRQRALLAAAADVVRPGGVLVYAVCTFSAAETLGVDTWAAEELVGFAAIDPPAAPWRPHGRGALLLPPDADTDGMYVLVLERSEVTAASVASVKIAPSILAADFAELAAEVERVADVADLLHVDCMDGHYVPNLTIGPPVVKSLRARTDLYLDCHLMVSNPGDLLDAFADAGADGCTIHVELGDPRPLFDRIRALGMRVGLTFEPETPYAAVEPYLEVVDVLLVMSVKTGFGGQPFIPAVLDKARAARTDIDARGLNVEIEIDGGITLDTAPLAVSAGIDIMVAGTAIFGRPDPAAAAGGVAGRGDGTMSARRAKVLTVSDGVIEGTREDRSGDALVEGLTAAGFDVVERRAVADGIDSVAAALRELTESFAGLVVTTGGTGFGPCDLTPEGTAAVIERPAPGLAEAIRAASNEGGRNFGMLSRAMAGSRGAALVVNCPGSPGGAREALDVIGPVLEHALDLLDGGHPH